MSSVTQSPASSTLVSPRSNSDARLSGASHSLSSSGSGASTPPNSQNANGVSEGFDFSSRSRDLEDDDDDSRAMDVDGEDLTPNSKTSSSHMKGQNNFVHKLYRYLEAGESDHVHWTEEGNAFTIKDPENFAKNEMANLFKSKQYSSFVRQLNMYDFHKKNRAPRARGVGLEPPVSLFEHAMGHFRRGYPQNLVLIKRKAPDAAGGPYPYSSPAPSAIAASGDMRSPTAQPASPGSPDRITSLQRQVDTLVNEVIYLRGEVASQASELTQLRAYGLPPHSSHGPYNAPAYPSPDMSRRASISTRVAPSTGSPLSTDRNHFDLGSPADPPAAYRDSLSQGNWGSSISPLSSSPSNYATITESSASTHHPTYPRSYAQPGGLPPVQGSTSHSSISGSQPPASQISPIDNASRNDPRSHPATTVAGGGSGGNQWLKQPLS